MRGAPCTPASSHSLPYCPLPYHHVPQCQGHPGTNACLWACWTPGGPGRRAGCPRSLIAGRTSGRQGRHRLLENEILEWGSLSWTDSKAAQRGEAQHSPARSTLGLHWPLLLHVSWSPLHPAEGSIWKASICQQLNLDLPVWPISHPWLGGQCLRGQSPAHLSSLISACPGLSPNLLARASRYRRSTRGWADPREQGGLNRLWESTIAQGL